MVSNQRYEVGIHNKHGNYCPLVLVLSFSLTYQLGGFKPKLKEIFIFNI